MIEIGRYNELRILRGTSVGLYLGDESDEDVLLPNKYCPESYKLEDVIKVFVYLDSSERKIATNIIPKIVLHEFAYLQVTAVTSVGAFLDWGLEKELFVPYREQKQKMEVGKWYIVYLDIDEKTDRLFASSKIEKHLSNEEVRLKKGEEVSLLVYQKTDLGFSAIVNHRHNGLIFKNEVFRQLKIGNKLSGFVKNIRKDNKIDLSLTSIGYAISMDANTDLIYSKLQENKGFLAITDKSSPDEIYKLFGISKKAFKKSIGDLYKQRKINLQADGIVLV